MATALKLRRGTTSQHASFTGSAAEVTVDTDKNTVVVHNGSTAGGIPLAKETNPTINGNVTTTGLNFDSNTLVIDAANNRVGVGTASPSSLLQLGNTSDANQSLSFSFPDSATALINSTRLTGGTIQSLRIAAGDTIQAYTTGIERMRLNASGNLGIGTSSLLGGSKVEIRQNADANYSSTFTTGTTKNELLLRDLSDVGTYSTPFSTLAFAAGSSGAAFATITGIRTASQSSAIAFGTATGSADTVERMRIDSSGNLGIGTTSPSNKIDVYSTGSSNARVRIGGTTNFVTHQLNNTSGDFYFAIDNSAGNALTGVSYGRALYSSNAYPMMFYTNATEQMRIDGSGLVYIRGERPALWTHQMTLNYAGGGTRFGLGIRPDANDTQAVTFTNAANSQIGYIFTTSSATSYVTSSDYRLKEDIAPMTGALDKVAQLKPVTYKWKVDGTSGQGFIAHELAEVVPDAVTGEKDAVDENGNPRYQGIDTSFLVATLTAAIQEQQAIITDLKARIETLESK
jgi:hypothetical protein